METTNTETNKTSTNTFGSGSKQLESGWQLVPRKIIGGLAAMWLISSAASELKELPLKQFALVIVCMFLLGLAAIATHYLLERKPNGKSPQIDADILTTNEHE